MKGRNKRIVRVLTVCLVFTMVSSIIFAAWYAITSKYSGVVDGAEIELGQLDDLEEGDTIAVVKTDAGDMTFALYPEIAPEIAKSFMALAETGFYDDTYVYRVEPGTFFCAGSKGEDGAVEDLSARSENIPVEVSPKLWPLRGALCAVVSHTDSGFWRRLMGKQRSYNGSRFLCVDTVEMTDEMKTELQNIESDAMKPVTDAFVKYGGIPNYAQQMTVFGQLKEGFEVLDAITDTEVTGEENAKRPKEPLRIHSVEIGKYEP